MSDVSRDSIDRIYSAVLEALKIVHEKQDGKGTIACPRCRGTLRYEKVSSDRGREWSRGACKTEGCVSWLA